MNTSGGQKGRLFVRAFLFVLGVVALMLQPFTVSIGQASTMTWIEICADGEGTLVQVDLSGGDADSEGNPECCEDCTNCGICASSMSGLSQDQVGGRFDRTAVAQATSLNAQVVSSDQKRAWPETRGPPAAKTGKSNCAARGAFTAIPYLKGGAL